MSEKSDRVGVPLRVLLRPGFWWRLLFLSRKKLLAEREELRAKLEKLRAEVPETSEKDVPPGPPG